MNAMHDAWSVRALAAALEYAAAGVPVFPVRPRDKQPLVAWGSEATTDANRVRDLWTRFPGAMVAAPTGKRSGLFVLDTDEKAGRSGSATLSALGFDLPTDAPLVRTPSGGRHAFFAWSHDLRNSEGKIGPGVDTRGEGGLVILAPSVRRTDGGAYAFVSDTTVAEFVAAARACPIPDSLRALLPTTPAVRELPAPVAAPELSSTFGTAMLERLKGGVTGAEGRRNVDLYGRAQAVGGYVAGGEITEEDAWNALDAMQDASGLPAEEAERAIRNGYATGLARPIVRPDPQELADKWHEPIVDDPDASPGDGSVQVLPNAGDILTEDVAARLFAERYQGKLRFDHDRGRWYAFDGSRWRMARDGRAYQWTRELIRALVRLSKPEVRYTTERAAFAGSVEKFAKVDPLLRCTSDVWDRDPWLLGTPTGTVDLRSGQLRPADPTDGITKATSVGPATVNDCPRWLAFLAEAMCGDAELVAYLKAWAGYSLTADTREQKLSFLHGPGGNGKGLFYGALLHVFGEYGKVAPFSTFVASRNEPHPTDLASMLGARLVVASEVDAKQAFAEARIKSLTGGDPIAARFMAKDFFEFQPTAKIMLVGNSLPRFTNVDDAARRRLRIVPFENRPRTVDMTLTDVFKSEAPGILAWAIEGCLQWQTSGLPYPAAMRSVTDGFFADQDVFGSWIADCCILAGRGERASTSDLFGSWQAYAKRAGEDPGSLNRFVSVLEQRGFERYRLTAERGFKGIRLRTAEDARANDGT